MTTEQQAQSNIKKLYLGAFLTQFFFFAPIIIPFFTSLNFSMREVFFIESIFFATIVVFEIPSGYFADRYGRRQSLIIGSIFSLAGAIIWSMSYGFASFLIGNFIWGLGLAFASGADTALLYESLLRLNKEKEYKKIQGNIIFIAEMSLFVSSIIGGLMTLISLRASIYATIIPFFVWFLVALSLKETRHVKEHETIDHFLEILKTSFWHNPKVRSIGIFSGVFGFFTAAFFLSQNYLEFIKIPLIYFGFIISSFSLLSGMGAKYAYVIEKKLGFKKLLIAIILIPAISWIALFNIASIWGIIPLLIAGALSGVAYPIFQDFVNARVASDRRATVLSIMSFIEKGLFVVISPFIGWVVDFYSIQMAFLVSGILILIFGFLSFGLLKKAKVV